jgi:hypothetical protein
MNDNHRNGNKSRNGYQEPCQYHRPQGVRRTGFFAPFGSDTRLFLRGTRGFFGQLWLCRGFFRLFHINLG